MKRFLTRLFKILSFVLVSAMGFGTVASAITIPPIEYDAHRRETLTYAAVYSVSPAANEQLDGFGVKDRVGTMYCSDGLYRYYGLYSFYAGGEPLLPLSKSIFTAYGVNVKTGEVSDFIKGGKSTDFEYKYQSSTDGKLSLYKYKSTAENYVEDDIFVATPTKNNDMVLAFKAPADGEYTFSEKLIKRYTVYDGRLPIVDYAVLKAGDDKLIAKVTSEATGEDEIDSQAYELNGKVELKKGEMLLFVMSVSEDATSNDGFYTRVKELTVTGNGTTYALNDYPAADDVQGYGEGANRYFTYDFSGKSGASVFNMTLGEKTPAIGFTAPLDARFKLSVMLQRESGGTSKFRVVGADGKTVEEFEVTTARKTLNATVTLKEGETFYFEYVSSSTEDSTVLFDKCNVTIDLLRTGELDREYDNSGQKPIYTVALMTDIHSDYERPTVLRDVNGVKVPVKNAFLNQVNYIKSIGGADAILVGGDTISEGTYHNSNLDKSKWTAEAVPATVGYIDEYLRSATKTGKNVFYVSGNHDKQPGVIVEYKDPNARLFSGDYSSYMLSGTGNFYDALYLRDIVGEENCRYPNEVLCYRYDVGGMYYIGLNQPYGFGSTTNFVQGANQFMYPQQITWLAEQLEDIGKDKTVFIVCHYNYKGYDDADAFGVQSGYASLGAPVPMLIETLEQYPNAIYTYGHLHWRDEDRATWYNTSENIWSFGNKMQLEDGSYVTEGYHFVHMGGVEFTATKYGENAADAPAPPVSQIMIVDFYNDHITFRVVNLGSTSMDPEVRYITSYTIKREMVQLDNYTGNGDTTLPEIPDTPEPPEEPVFTGVPEFLYDPSIIHVGSSNVNPNPGVSSGNNGGNVAPGKENKGGLNPAIAIGIGAAAVVVVGAITATCLVVVKAKKRKN